MNRNKVFSLLRHLITNPKNIIKVIDEEEDWKSYVVKKYGLNSGLPTLDLLDLCPNFNEQVYPYTYLAGTSRTIDIALLKALARRYRKCAYLEIGSWRGESVCNVATIADRCVSISLSNQEMANLGVSEKFIANTHLFSKEKSNITIIGHDSHTFDYSPFLNAIDLLFIDGDHRYEGVKIDSVNAFRLLRDNESIIVWHDYSFITETIRWSVLAGILDGSPVEKRSKLYHISNTMCAAFVPGSFETSSDVFLQIPTKIFSLNISAERLKLNKNNLTT
jgi:hypothetical protein